MLVVDVNVNRLLSTGISAGLGSGGDSANRVKQVLPGIDYSLTGSEINTILGASGIPFLTNIGPLKSNFYLQINAQESQGNIKVLTRPVISTLNGREASLTIGETQYFKLLTNTAASGAVNSFNQVSERLTSISYNTTLTVKPFVSDDNVVTLELRPNFTSPGSQSDPSIPPDIQTRQFSSTIRVKNGETVVLGGLSPRGQKQKHDRGAFFGQATYY